MTRFFNKIILITEIVRRNSLDEYFWPEQFRNPNRTKHILNRVWYEGWYCKFNDAGLELEIQYYVTVEQFLNWPTGNRKNLNIKSTEAVEHENFQLNLKKTEFFFNHKSAVIELVRNKMYISDRFKENAYGIWAAQVYLDAGQESLVQYAFGFERKLAELDKLIVRSLKGDIESLMQK